MAAKILPHNPTQKHKRSVNDQPQRELRSAEKWHRRDLPSWLGHIKDELGDASETLEGIARTSILLEKLSGEDQYTAANAHASLISRTAGWLDRLHDDIEEIIGEHCNRPEKRGGAR